MAETDWLVVVLCVVGLAWVVTNWVKEIRGHMAANGDDEDDFVAFAIASINEMLYGLVVQAQKEWGSGTGAVKRSDVVRFILNSAFYVALPSCVKLIVNATYIGELIDIVVVEKLKPAMANNNALQAKIEPTAGV